MTDIQYKSNPTLKEQEDTLAKQAIIKEALWLPATTQDDILEIARKILAWEQQVEEEK